MGRTGPAGAALAAARSVVLLLCLVLGPGPAAAQGRAVVLEASPRIALVISNSAYSGGGDPLGTNRSARLVAEELDRLGFVVEAGENLTKAQMQQRVAEVAARIGRSSVVVFFYNGYAIRSGQQNFLIPVGASVRSEVQVRQEGLDLDSILAEFTRRGAATRIVIVDAARRNPFEETFRRPPEGLAALDMRDGTLAIFSAALDKPPEEADDGGLFVRELLRQIAAPGVSAEQGFARTRMAVARATGARRVPWVSSSLLDDVFFATPGAAPRPPPAGPPPVAEAPSPPPASERAAGEGPRPGETFRDCPTCPELVVVPAGDFVMGGDAEYEKPAHRVTIRRPFAIGRHEVTFAQWDACVAAGGCKGDIDDHGFGRGDRPVIDVSYDDVQGYLRWLSAQTRRTYRLPSEAEWEYAARAGATSPFWWGPAVGSGRANCEDCSQAPSHRTVAVGSYRPNAFGLFDTAGNAAEWVEDCWNMSYRGAPTDGAAWRTGQCDLRVLRGGSFTARSALLRSGSRFRYDHDIRYYANGFRVVRELP
ncbi:SUMF1/EgtB/PvdO family nonheme iron enzyme [Methylobacterium sp. WSM2598]|uniref:SUMF1/EgtB/PvdO family nonheme iron enzyme n=1 Tax=Methylobacterium sp. WSM2598 TaxID=398261 RepID=UPI0003A124BF|nr:SUMF1/EgtB/PvdO family nonheme iron enzyme [Methylobacterium sp. WSM2598]